MTDPIERIVEEAAREFRESMVCAGHGDNRHVWTIDTDPRTILRAALRKAQREAAAVPCPECASLGVDFPPGARRAGAAENREPRNLYYDEIRDWGLKREEERNG